MERYKGSVLWFKKGYGFICPDGHEANTNDVFFHFSQIIMSEEDQYKTIEPGTVVSFSVGRNSKGPMATDIMPFFEEEGEGDEYEDDVSLPVENE